MRPSDAGYERPEGLKATALVIGFGRIGQIASQFLLLRQRRALIHRRREAAQRDAVSEDDVGVWSQSICGAQYLSV
jgi:hypothetical protein